MSDEQERLNASGQLKRTKTTAAIKVAIKNRKVGGKVAIGDIEADTEAIRNGVKGTDNS